MSRQHTTPYLVNSDTVTPLNSAMAVFDELWLQRFIFENPQVLPIDEIEPAFGALIPLCRELSTAAGPIDLAFINREGLLTLVECKLWTNPEARRKVVAQILDYAKEISQWHYEDLEKGVQRARKHQALSSLYQMVSGDEDEIDESEFVDNVTRNLKRGRFLLLIVGEGIREGVERISEFLQQHANLNFGFNLVEIAVFRLPDSVGGGFIVQPRVVAQTVEIERAVVRIEDDRLVVTTSIKPHNTVRRTKISEEIFFEELARHIPNTQALRDLFSLAIDKGLSIVPGKNSMMLKLHFENHEFNFGVFNSDGTFVNRGIASSTGYIGHPEIGEKYLENLASMIEGGQVYRGSSRFYWTVKRHGRALPIADILDVGEQWLDLIDEIMDELATVLDT